MFKKSEIGNKCGCGTPETVMKEHASKRYRLPEGYYGGFFRSSAYYNVAWWTLRCEHCKQQRDNIHITHWGSDGSRSPIIGAFPKDKDFERYQDIKRAILELMED